MAIKYITFPIETSADDLAATVFDTLMAQIPGYVPQEGNLESWLIEVLSRQQAETRDVATRVTESIFRYYGKTLLGIPAVDAARARVASTWTANNTAGYTIPAGTTVAFPIAGDRLVYFRTVGEVTIPEGQSSTANGEVELEAVDEGSAPNGLPAGTVTLVDSLSYVASITSTATTSGGVDAESDDDYMDRLADELRLLSPRPILEDDFAVLARRQPGVDRATAIDGYNPANGTYGNERMVSVALADTLGNPVPSDVKNAVAAYLESLRELNFVVNTIDPTYTLLNVTATLKRMPDADRVVVEQAATAAVVAYLDPANWDWSTTVRYNELVSLLSNIPGVDYVDNIVQPSGNVILPGVAALVRANTVSITVI